MFNQNSIKRFVANNCIVLVVFMVAKIISYIASFFIGFDSSYESRVTNANSNNLKETIISTVLFIAILAICAFISRKILFTQKSKLKNVLSVSSITIVGLILLIIDYNLGAKFALTPITISPSIIIVIILVFIPTIIIGLSMKVNNSNLSSQNN